ncbi:MAG: IS1 family transposase [Gammaproteobacteria bacterium]
MANHLPIETKKQIVHMLVEGSSLRSISRIVDVSINTVTKLLVDVGTACQQYHEENISGLNSKIIQCDEIWSFVYAKQKNVPIEMQGNDGVGDVWTWTAIDAESKFMIAWNVGNRDAETAKEFMLNVADRLNNRVQLTTDGLTKYLKAVDNAFGNDIDFAQLIKIYGKPQDEHRYSPAECTSTEKRIITGEPDKKKISTSYVERQNLNMRMGMRRFTRLTNAFSKKIENHCHSLALYFMYYNFVRIHTTIRVTPAMEVGLTKKLWTIEDLVKLADKY